VVAQQEAAYGAMMEELKVEREQLLAHFDQDTDIKSKILI
jgi:hypothetical protein